MKIYVLSIGKQVASAHRQCSEALSEALRREEWKYSQPARLEEDEYCRGRYFVHIYQDRTERWNKSGWVITEIEMGG